MVNPALEGVKVTGGLAATMMFFLLAVKSASKNETNPDAGVIAAIIVLPVLLLITWFTTVLGKFILSLALELDIAKKPLAWLMSFDRWQTSLAMFLGVIAIFALILTIIFVICVIFLVVCIIQELYTNPIKTFGLLVRLFFYLSLWGVAALVIVAVVKWAWKTVFV